MNLQLTYGEHITVLGMTGSGKTVFQQWLFNHFPRGIMYDVEDVDGWEYVCHKTVVISNIDQLTELLNTTRNNRLPEIHIVYKAFKLPYGDTLTNDFDNFCRVIFENITGIAVFCDELGMVNQLRPMDSQCPLHYGNLLLRGRKRQITFCGGAQRNQHIPKLQVTQSRHKFIFEMDGMDMMVYRKAGLLSAKDSGMLDGLPPYTCLYQKGNEYNTISPVPVLKNFENRPLYY